MLDIAAFMNIRDDVYYVDMAIKSVIPFIKGIYIQDQYSVDGSYEKILEIKKGEFGDRIYAERVDTGTPVRFHPEYNEPYYRTLAVRRAEEVFNPKWILRIDADDCYTEYFFNRLEQLLEGNPRFEGIRVSGDRPISKDYWAAEGSTKVEHTEWSPEGGKFGDPHTQLWKAGKYYFIRNLTMPGSYFHVVHHPNPDPVYWLPGLCNYHLHRLFGPKAYSFWEEGGEKIDRTRTFLPPRDTPCWYNSLVNMGSAEKRDFKWPEYILERWAKWEGGIW